MLGGKWVCAYRYCHTGRMYGLFRDPLPRCPVEVVFLTYGILACKDLRFGE